MAIFFIVGLYISLVATYAFIIYAIVRKPAPKARKGLGIKTQPSELTKEELEATIKELIKRPYSFPEPTKSLDIFGSSLKSQIYVERLGELERRVEKLESKKESLDLLFSFYMKSSPSIRKSMGKGKAGHPFWEAGFEEESN